MDSAASLYEKLLAQCKSNGKHTCAIIYGLADANCLAVIDVDAKVDGLTKLQVQFEKGSIEVRRVSKRAKYWKPNHSRCQMQSPSSGS